MVQDGGKFCFIPAVVMVMVENRLLLAHGHHVSKLFTGVEFFSTLQSNVRLRRLIVLLFDKMLYSAKIST